MFLNNKIFTYTYSLCVCYSSKLVSLILNMTKNSASYLTQLVQIKAFQLIGHLLEKVWKLDAHVYSWS